MRRFESPRWRRSKDHGRLYHRSATYGSGQLIVCLGLSRSVQHASNRASRILVTKNRRQNLNIECQNLIYRNKEINTIIITTHTSLKSSRFRHNTSHMDIAVANCICNCSPVSSASSPKYAPLFRNLSPTQARSKLRPNPSRELTKSSLLKTFRLLLLLCCRGWV